MERQIHPRMLIQMILNTQNSFCQFRVCSTETLWSLCSYQRLFVVWTDKPGAAWLEQAGLTTSSRHHCEADSLHTSHVSIFGSGVTYSQLNVWSHCSISSGFVMSSLFTGGLVVSPQVLLIKRFDGRIQIKKKSRWFEEKTSVE